MENIFDIKVREGIEETLESVMTEKEINDLIQKKLAVATKKMVIERLEEIIEAIKEDRIEDIRYYIQISSAGDGWGNTNGYISFLDISDCEDIADIFNRLTDKSKIDKR